MIIGLGIDPGLRSTGVSAIARQDDGALVSCGVRVLRTEKSKGAGFTRFRASADDQRRIHDLWTGIVEAIQVVKPQVIGLENYHVYEPETARDLRGAAADVLSALPPGAGEAELQLLLGSVPRRIELTARLARLQRSVEGASKGGPGLSQAARTIAVYGAALAAAFSAGVPVFVFEPSDRATKIGGRRGASKEEVGRAVEQRVIGLAAKMTEKVPQKTLKEHAWDASGLAILALDEYVKFRLDAGVG